MARKDFDHCQGIIWFEVVRAMWHQKFSDNLRDMGFRFCHADSDLWMRDRGDHYEYIAVMVDDLLIFSKEPLSIIEPLKKIWGYTLNGVGTPKIL